MRSNRLVSFALLACAAVACAAVASAAFDLADRCRRAVSAAAAYVLDGLSLFSEPKRDLQKMPHPRTGLTARERHDLGHRPAERYRTLSQWRMCPSV